MAVLGPRKVIERGAVCSKNGLQYDASYRSNLNAFIRSKQNNHVERGLNSLTSIDILCILLPVYEYKVIRGLKKYSRIGIINGFNLSSVASLRYNVNYFPHEP